jgi:hypothetical protein
MPKKPRQAHIPQQTKKRKIRRTPLATMSDAYLAPEPDSVGGFGQRSPVGPVAVAPEPAIRRAETRTAVVRSTGQLPTFERAYLVNELRQIGITAGGLLAFIVVLAVLLR